VESAYGHVQHSAGGAISDGAEVHEAAARGVATPSQALPHADRIQQLFGRHDVSSIQAHVGGEAAATAGAMGARAYATGNHVVLGQATDLHTVAHEAAHVVQQRGGVQLKGGVGQAGDSYERHADHVADAVVAGRSAEGLLDRAPGGGSGTGIQKDDNPAAPAAAATPAGGTGAPAAAAPAADETRGDQLRKAVLAAAEQRLASKTEIVSEAKIQDVREGMVRFKLGTTADGQDIEVRVPLDTPMKNFTTCIEFGGQTFRDGTKAIAKDGKEQQRLVQLLPKIMMILNQETQINTSLELFQKSIHNFDKPIADNQGRIAKLQGEVDELKAKEPTGNKAQDSATNQVIQAKESALHQIDAAVAQVEREKQKIQDKINKLKADAAALDAKDDALIRFTPNTTARPKPGEYVLLGAAGAQSYGVSDATKFTLAKGAFKHIAVFKESLPAAPADPSKVKDPNEKWEEWHTIDGGGVEPHATTFYIRLTDGMIFWQKPGTPWAAANSSLIGWIDANRLLGPEGPDGPGAAGAPAAAPK
jgi:hypothetical protein